MNTPTEIKLTETVKKGGCAAKLPAGELRSILERLAIPRLPELAVGTETMDDAALWDLGDGRYLIQTLDFFTPIVDDPEDFGAIAAANALSDVYAMGGEPRTALTILAFPMATLSQEVLFPLMKGAMEKISEAGACLAGGHSIDDDTLKFGFSVAGFVEKSKAWKNSGAKPGDGLVLTKPLGTGTIASALKNREAEAAWVDGAIKSMKTLNRVPDLLRDIPVNAATDITGFGLAAHALQMARASAVTMRFNCDVLPALPGAMECLERKVINRAHRTNGEYVKDEVDFSKVSELKRLLALDAQTSGGLLLSIPENQIDGALEKLRTRFPFAVEIGRVGAQSQQTKRVEFI